MDQFPRCDIPVNESWNHRDPSQKSGIPRRCDSDHIEGEEKRKEKAK